MLLVPLLHFGLSLHLELKLTLLVLFEGVDLFGDITDLEVKDLFLLLAMPEFVL